MTDSGITSWDGIGAPDNIVAKEDRVVLSISWPVNSESYGKSIEALVVSDNVRHTASITGNSFPIPSTWLQEGRLRLQLIMDNGAEDWKTNIIELVVGPSIDYASAPAPDPEDSWTDLMEAHEAATNPHPQYALQSALEALELRVEALE